MNKYSSLFVAAATAIIFSVSVNAQSRLAGKVVDVLDGKTVIVAISGNEVRVELEYIDVPGPDHLFQATVKDHLRDLLLGKMIEYRPRQILKDRNLNP